MRPQFEALTSLRFVAAFAIVLHHLQGVLWVPEGGLGTFRLGSAVSFFFVLSGFVLHHSYVGRIGSLGWPRFAALRFFRVWPAHVVVLALGVLWLQRPSYMWQIDRLSWPDLAQIVFLLQSWSGDFFIFWGLNGPSWSISTELFFYLCFPFLLVCLSRSAIVTCTGLVVLTAVWLYVASRFLFDPDLDFHAVALGYVNPLARVAEFGAGMLVSHVLAPRLGTGATTAALLPVKRAIWTGAELAVIALVVVHAGWIEPVIGRIVDDVGPVVTEWLFASSGAPIYVVAVALFTIGNGAVSRVARHPLPVWLGTISFALYLVHLPLMQFWADSVSPHVGVLVVDIVGYLIALVALSAAIYYLVELPGMAWSKRRFLRRGRSRVGAE